MFHLREGWFFVRLPDGSVEIIKRENGSPDAPVVARIVASPEDWASVIASVSLMGDHAENFRKAVELHSGLTTNAADGGNVSPFEETRMMACGHEMKYIVYSERRNYCAICDADAHPVDVPFSPTRRR